MRIPLAESVLLFGIDSVEAAVPAPVRSTLSKPSEGGDTFNVTVRATPSVKTMFTASPAVGTPAGLQVPGLQLAVPSAQFFAVATAAGDNTRMVVRMAPRHDAMRL